MVTKDLNKKEKLLVEQTPQRSPDLTSRAAFIQEKNFHQNAYGDLPSITIDFINLNYDYPYYGKVNSDLISISPKKEVISQINNSDNTIFALNFVKDAFEDFLKKWNSFKRRNLLIEEGVLYSLQPQSGYEDVEQAYKNIMSVYGDELINFIINNNHSNKIKDLRSFIKIFSYFVDAQTPFLPVTLSFFNLSRFFDMRGSGLIIDLSRSPKDKDQEKIKNWIQDPNFQLYKNTLEYYGFSIEKNTPWRIVANIDSIPMQEYMKKYKINKNNLFKNYYNNLNLKDLNLLKENTTQFYENFIDQFPKIVKSKSKICNNKAFVSTESKERKPAIDNSISDLQWLRLYVFTRAREVNVSWEQAKFETIVDICHRLSTELDLKSAMRYLEGVISTKQDTKRKNKNFTF